MKRVLQYTFLILFLVAFFSPLSYATPDKNGRAMWVWEATNNIIDDYFDNDGIAREKFLSFCAAPHGDPTKRITTLFMSAQAQMNFKTSTMRRFLADMNNRGFKVYLIISDPLFGLPTTGNPADVTSFKNTNYEDRVAGGGNFLGFIPFQEGAKFPNEERFAGLMLDIEPHQLGIGTYSDVQYKWFLLDENGNVVTNNGVSQLDPDGFPVIWNTYKNLLDFTKQQLQTYNTARIANGEHPSDFSDAIASFYPLLPEYELDNGDMENLSDAISKFVDFYTVLAYRDHAELDNGNDGSIAFVEDVIDRDNYSDVPFVVTVETSKDLLDSNAIPDNITFWEEGNTVLETELGKIFTHFDPDPRFSGLSIHAYQSVSTPFRGYQNLIDNDTSQDKAPIITITSPNGVPVDGINFTGDITIRWDSYVPENRNYTIELFYAFQSTFDINNDTNWTSITSQSFSPPNNTPPIAHGSYIWTPGAGVTSTNSNRIFIIARISYDSGDALPSADTTDYGVAINETANIPTDAFGETQVANLPGVAYSLQIIPDNDTSGILHAVYYIRFGTVTRGVYYARSTDWGNTWTNPISLSGDSHADFYPRKPSFHKKGQYLAVAWVENATSNTSGELNNNKILIRMHDNDGFGNISTWSTIEDLSDRRNPTSNETPTSNYPEVYVDNDGNVHVVWYSIYRTAVGQPFINYIHYIEYDRTSSAWMAQAQIVKSTNLNLGEATLKSPSITTSSSGVHVVWGEYDNEAIISSSSTSVNNLENFDGLPVSDPANFSSSVYGYGVFGVETTNKSILSITGTPSDHFLRISYSSPTDGGSSIIGGTGPFVSSVLSQGTAFSPALDLSGTNTTIEFDMKTNLVSGFAKVLAVEIFAEALFGDNTPTGDGQVGFRNGIKDNNMLDLPGQTWTHFVVDVTDLTTFSNDQSVTSKKPNLANVTKVQILILQTDADLTGTGNIDINNLKIVSQTTTNTTVTNLMNIRIKTKSGASWPLDDIVIRSRQYATSQIPPSKPNEEPYHPVFFPKITTADDNLYVTWQETVYGTPSSDGLEQFSDILFNRSFDGGTTWLAENSPIEVTSLSSDTDNGYNPNISAYKRDNDGRIILQIVYSKDFSQIIQDELYSGSFIFTESDNSSGTEGDLWTTPVVFASSATYDAIRRPYITINGVRATLPESPPFIYTSSDGTSIVAWFAENEKKHFKVRGDISSGIPVLFTPPPPFVNLLENENDGFSIKWDPPQSQFAANSYTLRRIPYDNDGPITSQIVTISPIFTLNYTDNFNPVDNTYYRYEMRYTVNSISSLFSSGSNVIKKGTQLLLDDFELLSDGVTHFTDIKYVRDNSGNSFFASPVFDSQSADTGATGLKLSYTGDLTDPNAFAVLNLTFPTTMDFSKYGSIDIRFSLDNVIKPIQQIRLQEDENPVAETYIIGNNFELSNDGQFHTWHFFLDQIKNAGGGDGINLDRIKTLQIFVQGSANTEFLVDNIVLSNDIVLELDNHSINNITVKNDGTSNKGVVITPQIPINVKFGNAKDPWYLRIYTESEYDNNGNPIIKKSGLIMKKVIGNETIVYNIPIKVWIANFGPARFFDANGNILYIPYQIDAGIGTKGFPPVDNPYFWSGFDFDGNGEKFSTITENDGIPIVEGTDPGEYPFDIDGDGFHEDDDFFADGDGKKLSENPVWLFVPLKLDVDPANLTEEDNDALAQGLIMLPFSDQESVLTWRNLASTFIGHSNHDIDMYFSIAINTEGPDDPPNAYGTYTAEVIVDLVFN